MCCAQSLQSCLTLCDLWTVACQAHCPWDSPGKNTGVGCCALLQGIFPTQKSNPFLGHAPALQAGSLSTEPPRKPSLLPT